VIFAREGAKIFAVDKNPDSMVETVERVGNNGEIATHVCDVLDNAQVRDMAEACRKAFGRIDILVNNVGGSAAGAPPRYRKKASTTRSTTISKASSSPAGT